MYVKYGNYQHPVAECAVGMKSVSLWSKRMERYALRVTWDIQGFLQAADAPSLTIAIQKLEAAYANDYQDIALFNDDGTLTAHQIKSASTINGNRVIEGVSYPDGTGAQYSTYRSYRIRVEGEVKVVTRKYLDFHETIMMTGGGPRFVLITTRNGPSIRQQTSQQTPYRATQSGFAVGLYGYPPIPPPIWPDAEHVDQREISPESPELRGKNYFEYKKTWKYFFSSTGPLNGAPNVPPLV